MIATIKQQHTANNEEEQKLIKGKEKGFASKITSWKRNVAASLI